MLSQASVSTQASLLWDEVLVIVCWKRVLFMRLVCSRVKSKAVVRSLDLSLWQPLIEDRAFVPWLVRQPTEQVGRLGAWAMRVVLFGARQPLNPAVFACGHAAVPCQHACLLYAPWRAERCPCCCAKARGCCAVE